MANFTKKKKNYVKGSAKAVTFQDGGEIINIDLLLSSLESLPVNKAGYVKITLSKYREVDKFGNTHAIYENDFVPDASQKGVKKSDAPSSKPTTDKLPF